jgi:pimeloyl-ACP methyl ester carboxylesterase
MTIFGAGVLAALGVAMAYRWFWHPAVDAQANRQDSPSEFYLDVPGDYSPDRDWPVFVGVHGSGGTGLDCWRMWQVYAHEGGFILVCPSLVDANSLSTQSANEQTLIAILDRVSSEYATRPQVFLAGFSAGGTFVQGYAFNYPGNVSGAAVISAGVFYTPTPRASHVPFLVIVGDQDSPRRLNGSQELAQTLAQAGYWVELHLLPGVGHDAPPEAIELTISFFRRVTGE